MGADLIGTQWREYRTKVIPLTAPQVQATESRRAFYAGAYSLLLILKGVNDQVTEDEGVRVLEDIERELLAFADRVRQGAA